MFRFLEMLELSFTLLSMVYGADMLLEYGADKNYRSSIIEHTLTVTAIPKDPEEFWVRARYRAPGKITLNCEQIHKNTCFLTFAH